MSIENGTALETMESRGELTYSLQDMNGDRYELFDCKHCAMQAYYNRTYFGDVHCQIKNIGTGMVLFDSENE